MRAAVLLDRREQVVVARRVERLVGLLRAAALLGEAAVEEPRRERLADDGEEGRPADPDLAPAVVGGMIDGVGGISGW